MKWEKYIQGMFTGGIFVEIRSLKIRDESCARRRYRVCSTDAQNDKFTRRPARGKLVKSEDGKLGVAVHPNGAGFVKVGKKLGVQPVIFAPMESVSKKPAEKLLKQVNFSVFDSGAGAETYEE